MSKLICKEDFYDYAEWHEFLEEHVDKYEYLDDNTIVYFVDVELGNH